uniref:Guanylate cyclase 1 soluble subunit alpha 1 n=1 Tax=Aotus nancymaae TaxID=37293 RepID=A0A2K5CCA5_AOTNA
MFCTKLKDLKITGECPFSLLAPGQVPKESAEEAAGSSESCKATVPICQDIPEKNIQESLPQRKTSGDHWRCLLCSWGITQRE